MTDEPAAPVHYPLRVAKPVTPGATKKDAAQLRQSVVENAPSALHADIKAAPDAFWQHAAERDRKAAHAETMRERRAVEKLAARDVGAISEAVARIVAALEPLDP